MDVEDKNEYLDWLKADIGREYNCPAYYLRTQTVHETLEGSTEWLGDVEVFGLISHLEASRCFAWRQEREGSDSSSRLVIMLATPPAVSAPKAVRIQLMKDLKLQLPN
jgi:hypothetical protein